ncbi:MAG: Glu/Leu/Phe/Val dehydrogenase dimerization domain-containing protein [Pseudomonadales bacterium]
MQVFEAGHEQVVIREDAATGLRAIIALHSTVLGPAAGGCRHWVYPDAASALDDALRLSRGMTFKNALADIPFGGGKSVILGARSGARSGAGGRAPLTEPQLETFGTWIEALNGRYLTAEDVGISVDDMRVVARTTRYVSGLGTSGLGGDPSPRTAEGVFNGIRAAVRTRLGTDDLAGVRVAVQGLGNVGWNLAERLREHGAELWVADIAEDRVQRAESELGARALAVDEVLRAEVDVVAPCALGGALTGDTVAALRASIVAGAANNQLASDDVGELLSERGVLYAPDYVINAGGVISIAAEYLRLSDPAWVDSRIAGIAERLEAIFRRAAASGEPTSRIADAMAGERLERARPGYPGPSTAALSGQ